MTQGRRRRSGKRTLRRAPGRKVVLAPGREKPMERRHPWIFSGAIAALGDALGDGDVADVTSSDGAFLARGMVSLRSQITVRILTFDEGEAVDGAFWARRISRSFAARPSEGAFRCVNAESDGLPGLVVDRYGDFLVVQVSSVGIERHKG